MMAPVSFVSPKRLFRYVSIFLLPVFLTLLFPGCTPSDSDATVLRIAEQHGLAYIPAALLQAPSEILGEIGGDAIADFRRDVKLEWVRVNNATAIREAMVAGRLDVGFMGIPPYLIGRDRGFSWRAFTGLSRSPLGLVTLNRTYRSMDDLVRGVDSNSVRIALPQPGSIQHILLAMALEERYGEPTLLDDRLVSMGHPDGMSALLSGAGDIDAHFTAPPFLFRELAHPDATLLVSGDEAFGGPFTFIVGVVAPTVSEGAPVVTALKAALESAMNITTDLQIDLRSHAAEAGFQEEVIPLPGSLNRQSLVTLEYLADFFETDPARLGADLLAEGLVFETDIRGMEGFVRGMQRYGYIR